jgi:hypothetical protein
VQALLVPDWPLVISNLIGLCHQHHGCQTAHGGDEGIVITAARPSAVAELPKTVRIRIRRNFTPKTRQTREND